MDDDLSALIGPAGSGERVSSLCTLRRACTGRLLPVMAVVEPTLTQDLLLALVCRCRVPQSVNTHRETSVTLGGGGGELDLLDATTPSGGGIRTVNVVTGVVHCTLLRGSDGHRCPP